MPGPRDARIERLSGITGTTVITATARLARELARRFDRHQLAAGKQAWESADVLPWNAWLQRTWRNLGVHLEHRPLLLNELQVVAVWEDLIRNDVRRRQRDAAPLWNVHATAKSAVGAWRILNAWNIPLEDCARSSQEDHQCLVRWARRFRQLCAERNWTDPYCLADRLREVLAGDELPPELKLSVSTGPIELAGFDHLLPQQQSLIEALKAAGIQIETGIETPSPDAPANPETAQKIACHHYSNETLQWLSAARWAREKLSDNPEANLAIIAPDLNRAAPAIEYALQQLLCPQQLAGSGTDFDLSASRPYHLSLGKKLSRHPLAKAALIALAPLAGGPLPGDAFGQLIRSPFILGADSEATARAKLERWCRRRLPYQLRFRQFLKELPDPDNPDNPDQAPTGGPHCPRLLEALRAVLPLLEDAGKPQSAGHWAHHFGEWLKHIGWPGERALDSDEFQAERAYRRQLRNLALLDLTTPPMNAATALGWLRRRVDEQPFQVEAHDAPVQVLGVVEAAGQRFDGIWFGGLVEADWPPAQRPNPFIAAGLQREAGVFEASLERNRERAALQQQRLIASADEVVFSRPHTVDEVPTQPSPLLSGAFESHDAQATDFDTPANLLHRNQPALQSFSDARGSAFARETVALGGASLIENQAKCPFRAFAIHRLGAREVQQNQQGLDAGERGSLIHHALQLAWQKIRGSAELQSLTAEKLGEIIRDAAEQAGRRYQVSSGCGERFHHTQVRWARDTLAEWFDIEKQRPGAFVVSALEQETALHLNGLHLAVKTDRIDRMENGALALIDYKTGAPGSLQNWNGARPQSPQLPLYALAQEAAVETVAYGRVRRGDCGFSGVARESEFGHGVRPLESSSLKKDFADWDELMAHWRTALSELAQEFLDGEARVAPINAGVCERCDLHGLCRIGAQPQDQL